MVVRENRIVVIASALFILMAVGVFYSPASYEVSLDFMKKYRVLLYIPIVMSLCYQNEKIRENTIKAFFIGYIILTCNALLVDFGLIADNKIALDRHGGGFLVIFAYIAIQRAVITLGKLRLGWIFVAILICYDLFFILGTRTGWLIFLVLSLLFLFQHFSIKKQILIGILLVCSLLSIFQLSSNFRQRLDMTVTNLKSYDIRARNSMTSIGVRLDWYQNSFDLIKAKPFLGYGTGAFAIEQEKLIRDKDTQPTSDPHNEFFLVSVQTGIIGGLLFFLLLIEPLWKSMELMREKLHNDAHALQALIVFFAVGCIFNSWLLTSIPSHMFALLLAVFYSHRQNTEYAAIDDVEYPTPLSS